MEPYYSDESGIDLYCGDFREILPKLGIQGDMVIADPPYGETSLEWDKWPAGWVSHIPGIMKPAGSLWCFGSMRMFLDQKDDFAGWRFVQDVIWEKHNGSGMMNDRFKRVHEIACQFVRHGAKWKDVFKKPQFTFDSVKRTVQRKYKPAHCGDIGQSYYESEDGGPRLMRSVLQIRSCHGRAVHRTQKPEDLCRPLISYSCPIDGLLVSPFAGSGTDLVVAKELGIRAIGVEIDETNCRLAVERLKQGILYRSPPARIEPTQAESQSSLFAA